MTVISAAVALVGGGIVAGNLAGAASGISALDYAQCDNGGAGTTLNTHCPASSWINGILNTNNSQYNEDDVTPQRLLVQFPDKGNTTHNHTITLRYLDRKGGIHAYDYLAAADATQTTAIDERCNGLATAICPTGTASTASVIPAYAADTTAVNPDNGSAGSGLAKDHMANLKDGVNNPKLNLSLFGATFNPAGNTQKVVTNATPDSTNPAISTPTHDNALTASGDDYGRVVLSFTTTGPGPHNVQLLFGGHLAAGFNQDGWGESLGAGSVSGGPYHIKWDAADGLSVGNRDNQIMSSAIGILPQGSTLSTTPSKTSETVGSDNLKHVTDDAFLTPDSGQAPTGTMTFTLYGPLTAPDYLDCTDPDNSVDPVVVGNVVAGPDTGHALALDSGTTYKATSSEVDMSGFDPGVYQWVADYVANGDPFNTDVNGDCGDSGERVTINKADPTGSSSQIVTDTVTVSGAGTPSGYVDFYLYTDCADTTSLVWSDVYDTVDPSNPDNANNVLSGGSAKSEAFEAAVDASQGKGAVTYYWQVAYTSDDGNNNSNADLEHCGDQQFTIQNSPA